MLNKNKPFGIVIGAGIAYKYEQDGKYFNQAELEVTDKGVVIEPKLTIAAKESLETQQAPVREYLKDSDNIDLEDLTAAEIREQLDRFGVKYKVRDGKPDLIALLREEILNRSLDDE